MLRFTMLLVLLFGVASLASGADSAELLKSLKSPDAKVRQKAAESFAATGDDSDAAAAVLCEVLMEEKNAEVIAPLLTTLEGLRPRLYHSLSQYALEVSLANKAKAVQEIGSLGRRGKPAIAALLKIVIANNDNKPIPPIINGRPIDRKLHDSSLLLSATLDAINAIGIQSEESALFFAEIAVSTQNDKTKMMAQMILTRWADRTEGSEKVVFPVIKTYLAQDASVHYGCRMLVEYGEKAKKEFGATLAKLKLSPSASVRQAAANALKELAN